MLRNNLLADSTEPEFESKRCFQWVQSALFGEIPGEHSPGVWQDESYLLMLII